MEINQTVNQLSFPIRTIPLKKGDRLNVEPGGMHACKNTKMNVGLDTSIWNAAARYFLGGESFLTTTYTAEKDGAWVALEEGHQGQVASYTLSPLEKLTLEQGAYVASDSNVDLGVQFRPLSFARGIPGMWNLSAKLREGTKGRVFFDTKEGVIKQIKITKENGPVIVDNEHIIGHAGSLEFTLHKMGNLKSLVFSGEGLVNKVIGEGTVFVGTRQDTVKDRENYVDKFVENVVQGMADKIMDGTPPKVAVTLFFLAIIVGTSRVAQQFV